MTPIQIEGKTIEEVLHELNNRLRQEDLPVEQFRIIPDIAFGFHSRYKPDSTFPCWRWIACYAVSDRSEGHWVHVDVITPGGKPIPLYMSKIFGGFDRAFEIAKVCAQHLGA